MKQVIIYDTEYYTDKDWMGLNENPNPDLPRHLIQIGALKLDAATLAVVEEYDMMCKPPLPLTDEFTRLSGISQQQVDARGVSFADIFRSFWKFKGDAPLYSYGSDIEVLRRNLGYNNMPLPVDWPAVPENTNIRPFIQQHAPETIKVNSGRLVEVLGIRPRHKEHTGLGDCHSIRETLIFLIEKRGAPNPFLRR